MQTTRYDSAQLRWVNAAATLGSLVLHGLLVFGVGRIYHSSRNLRHPIPPREMAYVELAPLPALPLLRPSVPLVGPATTEPINRVESGEADQESVMVVPVLSPVSVPGREPSAAYRWHPLLQRGFLDSRLYIGTGSSALPDGLADGNAGALGRELRERIRDEDNRAKESRQINILGHRITVFGDTAAAYHSGLHLNIAGQRRITPLDGRDWENLETRRHNDAVVRDSILRERTRAIRERVDAQRDANRERSKRCRSPIPAERPTELERS